jgi:hypothetical protein
MTRGSDRSIQLPIGSENDVDLATAGECAHTGSLGGTPPVSDCVPVPESAHLLVAGDRQRALRPCQAIEGSRSRLPAHELAPSLVLVAGATDQLLPRGMRRRPNPGGRLTSSSEPAPEAAPRRGRSPCLAMVGARDFRGAFR